MKLVVANVEEYYAHAAHPIPEAAKAGWRESSAEVAGGAFFWGGGEKTLLWPFPAESGLVLEVGERMGFADFNAICPEYPVEDLCGWAARDEGVLCRLKERLGGKEPEIMAWGATRGVHELLNALKRRGIETKSNYGAVESLWAVRVADSKCGLRALLGPEEAGGKAAMPEGEIASNLAEAAFLAERLLSSGFGAVVKGDAGVGGHFNIFFHEGRKSWHGIIRRLKFAARRFPELAARPLVVERLVGSNIDGRNNTCSAQCEVDASGMARVLFLAEHVRFAGATTRDRPQHGLKVGPGLFSPDLSLKLEKSAMSVCRALARMGYAGVLGIDFAVLGGDEPKVLEVNARRTTASGPHEASAALADDKSGRRPCVLLIESVKAAVPWAETGEALKKLLYPGANAGAGRAGWLPVPACKTGAGRPDWAGAMFIADTHEGAELLFKEFNSVFSRDQG